MELPATNARHDAFTPERRARFIDVLAEHGNVRAACAAVGISPEAAYRLRRRDFAFGESWQVALVQARAHVEQVLADRAIHGVEEEIWYRGELVGTRRRYDGRLLLAHLARLDRLAEEAVSPDRVERFDEVLAVAAGERFAAALGDLDDGPLHSADPLLPMERDRCLDKARSFDESDQFSDYAFEDEGEDEDEDEDGPDGEGGPGEARGTPQPSCYEAAETGWNAWQARVNAIRAAVDAERDDGLEIKSLGSVNRVNTLVDDATACRKALRRPAISLPLMARIGNPAWG